MPRLLAASIVANQLQRLAIANHGARMTLLFENVAQQVECFYGGIYLSGSPAGRRCLILPSQLQCRTPDCCKHLRTGVQPQRLPELSVASSSSP